MPAPSPNDPAVRRGRLESALACAGLVAAVAAVYVPVTGHGFVNLDDDAYVYANPRVRGGLTLASVRWALTSREVLNWHPITWLSHLADVSLFGLDPGAHHAVSASLHAANALLLFWALLSLTGRRWPSAFAAALFAVHPLHVEPVAWIAERKELLSFFFGALALVAYGAYARAPSWRRYAGVAVAFALALLAKPMLVTLPFVLLLLDVWPLGRLPLDARRWREGARLLLEKAPLLLLSAGSSAVTLLAQGAGHSVVGAELLPLGERVANAAVAPLRYLGHTLWPAGLSAYYPLVPVSAGAAWAAALLLAAVTAGAVAALRTRPYLAVGWLWYLGTLLPVIGLVQVGGQAMADRYTYFPLVGIFVAVAWGAGDLARTPGARRRLALAAGVALLALGVAARRQVGVWRGSTELWEHALRVSPENWMAETNLGKDAFERGDLAGAAARFERARRLRPDSAITLTNLGTAVAALGRHGEALALFEQAVRRDPADANAWYNLGVALLDAGRPRDAEAAFATTRRLEPGDLRPRFQTGLLLLGEGRFDEALRQLGAIVEVDPDHPGAQTALGIALANLGRIDEAIVRFQIAVRLRPDDRAVRENLELALQARARAAAPRP